MQFGKAERLNEPGPYVCVFGKLLGEVERHWLGDRTALRVVTALFLRICDKSATFHPWVEATNADWGEAIGGTPAKAGNAVKQLVQAQVLKEKRIGRKAFYQCDLTYASVGRPGAAHAFNQDRVIRLVPLNLTAGMIQGVPMKSGRAARKS